MTPTQCVPGLTLFWGNKYYCHCAVTKKSMAYGDSRHFQKYFSLYIVVVSFIGVGNRSTKRKPPTGRKSLTKFITECYIE